MAGTVKGFRIPVEYVLYDISYANIIMMGATLPSYNSKRDKNKHNQEVIMADDPRNKDRVATFFNSIR